MEFNPSRLVIARKRRGFTRVSLARDTSLGVRSIQYYETGEVDPSDDAVCALVRALRFPQAFFYGPDMEELSPQGASFRSLRAMSAAQRDSALAAGSIGIELCKWIEQRFELPEPSVPDLREFEPETAAQVLRTEWSKGERPIRNMVEILEAHGVCVFSLPVDSSAVDAFSTWHHGRPIVFLNPMKSAERGRMDAAHELGHLTLHKHGGGPRNRYAEMEADRFGSAFLMPAGDVLAHAPRGITTTTILNMKHRWGVSAIALVYRLKILNILSEWHYRTLCIELSKMGYRRNEPEGRARDTSQVLAKVLGILREKGIPRSAVAKELRIDLAELDSLLVGLVIASMPGGRSRSEQSQAKRQKPDLRVV